MIRIGGFDLIGELVGGLIQMNSHMELSGAAVFLLVVGGAVALVCFCAAISVMKNDKVFGAILMAFAVAGVIAMIIGTRLPKEQIIHACADGQVSLEQVSGRYDIIEVDGKELTLRVRR